MCTGNGFLPCHFLRKYFKMLLLISANVCYKPTDYMVLKMDSIIIPREFIFKFRWDKRHTDGRGKEGRMERDKKKGRKDRQEEDVGEHRILV